MRCHARAFIVALVAALLPHTAHAGDRYYVLIFGAQKPIINNPNYTHSFAAFVHAVTPDCDGQPAAPAAPGAIVESFPISWMPRAMKVRVNALLPEPGVNLPLDATLRWAVCNELRISMWGPFEIEHDLYEKARRHANELESGSLTYKSEDIGFPRDRVSNCIHGLTDVTVRGLRLRIATPGWGESASFFIALSARPWIIDERRTHDWLIPALGLDGYPLVRRDLGFNWTVGPLNRVLQSTLRITLLLRGPR